MPKRRRAQHSTVEEDATPPKARRAALRDQAASTLEPAETPSGSKSILRGTPSKLNGATGIEPTPKSLRTVLFATPAKATEDKPEGDDETPTATQNDRSARRKSQRTLQKRAVIEDASDDEDAEADAAIALQVLDDDASHDDDEDGVILGEPSSAPDTPSKSGKLRGRPKGRRRERTPSPPPDLPPHELYFFQNRAGGNKTSANSLPSHLLLNHENYFIQINAYQDPHASDIDVLTRMHERAFDQWLFELDEGFNLCLYGYGSKRELVMDFAQHMYVQAEAKKPTIVVVNGYAPGLTVRDILGTLGGVILPNSAKLPAQPAAMLDVLLATLDETPPATPITLLVHSLDHANLRKGGSQALIARLAAHRSISLMATCDTPTFPLLWDINLTRQLRFLYHDATTFQPYRVEIDVVEEVNALLGRRGRRLGGKDGVAYVLKSLPENARNLFRMLVAEQLAVADAEPAATLGAVDEEGELDPDDIFGTSDEEAAGAEQATPSRRGRGRPAKSPKATPRPFARPSNTSGQGVEYRTLYHKAVEGFVCSSELNFRTLLKEFHDHQMIESRKDVAGTERLSVPMGREDLEQVMEELV